MFTDGSIAGYDAVLSVSEEAINRQLEVLYNTPIQTGRTVVTEVEGFGNTTRSKFLINHDFRIRPLKAKPKGNDIYQKHGITGHIGVPRVSFKGQDPGYVGITIAFKKDESVTHISQIDDASETLPDAVQKGPADSWAYYYEGEDDDLELITVNINGWTMSWRSKLAQEDVQDVMEKLIKPAKSTKSSVATTDELTNKLEKVASEDFLVSSIFCVIESHDFMDHFMLKDLNGQEIKGSNVTTAFPALLSKYFSSMKTHGSIPNPNNPFILGYGISQKLPTLQKEHPELSFEKTPKYFIPRNFHFSITKGAGLTAGTLNYLMLTHRSDPNEQPRDSAGADRSGAGEIAKDFFTTTKMRAEQSDAVMAFCRDAFLIRWLKSDVLNQVHITMKINFDLFWTAAELVYKAAGSGGMARGYERFKSDPEVMKDTSHPTIQWVEDWKTKQTNIVDILEMGGCDVWQMGKSTTRIELHSTLQDEWKDQGVLPSDAERSVYLVIRWRYVVRMMFETFGPLRLGGTSEAYSQKISFGFKDIVKLTTKGESGGEWTVEPHQPGSTLPHSQKDFSDYLETRDIPESQIREPDITDESGDNYAATGSSGHGGASIININDYVKVFPKFKNTIAPVACFALGETIRGVGTAFDNMQYTVMMPGGEAFNYKGLDADADGNLYSHLAYKKGAAGATTN